MLKQTRQNENEASQLWPVLFLSSSVAVGISEFFSILETRNMQYSMHI